MELDEETAALASGTLWQNAGNIAMKLVSFVYTVLVARLVSQEEVGLFYFALSLVGIITIFADFGLSQTVQRYVPYYLGKGERMAASRVLALSVLLSTALLLAVTVIAFFAAPSLAGVFNNPGLGPVLAFLAIYLCINQCFNIASSVLVALKQMRERSIGANLQNLLKLAFTIALVAVLGPNARALAAAFMLSFIAGAFYLLWALRTALRRLDLPPPSGFGWCVPMLADILPFGLTMVSISMFGVFIGYTDRVLLGYLLPLGANVQIAIYSFAINLASLAGLFAASITIILLPVASGLISHPDATRIHKAARTSMRWMLFSALPLAAFLAAFSAPLLRVVYGAAYEPGALSLSIFTIGTVFFLLGTVQGTLIAAHRLVRLELKAFMAGAAVNIILNLLLIPRFGINGSAFAGLVCFAVIAWVNQHYAARRFGFSIPSSVWKNLLAGALVGLLLFALEQASYGYVVGFHLFTVPGSSVAAGVMDKAASAALLSVFFCIGSLAYLVLLNLMRLFEREDRRVFEKIAAKAGLPHPAAARLADWVFWNLPGTAQK